MCRTAVWYLLVLSCSPARTAFFIPFTKHLFAILLARAGVAAAADTVHAPLLVAPWGTQPCRPSHRPAQSRQPTTGRPAPGPVAIPYQDSARVARTSSRLGCRRSI